MVKRESCARCGSRLAQPATGRPKVYCGPLCRRDAEYRLRRVQSHLGRAERSLAGARAKVATWPTELAHKQVEFWSAEVEQLSSELRAVLADQAADEESQPAA